MKRIIVIICMLICLLGCGFPILSHADGSTIPTPDQYRASRIIEFSSYDFYVHGDCEWAFATLARLLASDDSFMEAVALWKVGTFNMSDAAYNPFYESVIHDTLTQHYSESKLASTLNKVMKSTQISMVEKINKAMREFTGFTEKAPIPDPNTVAGKKFIASLQECEEISDVLKAFGNLADLTEYCLTVEDALNKFSQARALQLMGADVAVVLRDMANVSSNADEKRALGIMANICDSTLSQEQILLLFAGEASLSTLVSKMEGVMWSEFLAAIGPFGTGMAVGSAIGKTAMNWLFSIDDIIEHFYEMAMITDYESSLKTTLNNYEVAYGSTPNDENAKKFNSAYMYYLDLVAQGLDYANKFLDSYYKGGVASEAWQHLLYESKWENYEKMKQSIQTMKDCVLVEAQCHSQESTYELYTEIYFSEIEDEFYNDSCSMTQEEINDDFNLAIATFEEITDYDPINYINYLLENDCVKITGYKGKPFFLTIPSTIDGIPVTTIDSYSFSSCQTIKKMSIPSTVESIGREAFADCSNLSDIEIMGNNLQRIDLDAFQNCVSLKQIHLPDSITTIDSFAFDGCVNLTDVNYPINWESGPSSYWGSPFTNCPSLKTMIIPEGVTSIPEYAFSNRTGNINVSAPGLTYVSLPSTLLSISSYAFKGVQFESISIPQSVTSIGREAFADCSQLKTIYIPRSINYVGLNSFSGCASLKNVFFAGSTSEKERISFSSGNEYLISASWIIEEIFNVVTLSKELKTIEAEAFYGIYAEKIVVPETTINIGSKAFAYCENLIQLELPSGHLLIANDILEGCNNVIIICKKNSDASIWAEENNYTIRYK